MVRCGGLVAKTQRSRLESEAFPSSVPRSHEPDRYTGRCERLEVCGHAMPELRIARAVGLFVVVPVVRVLSEASDSC